MTTSLLTMNSLKRTMAAAVCAATLTIVTATPGFAASGFGNDTQGRVPEFSPGLPGCPDCIGIGIKPVHKILPDTIMEPVDKIIPDTIMEPIVWDKE